MHVKERTASRTARILIIDDEPLVLRLAATVLSSVGHTIFQAADGKSGETLFYKIQPELTILDIWMPEQDGLQTIRHLRAHHPEAKILVMSGQPRRAGMPVFEVASVLGAVTLLNKPFTPDELLASVEAALTA